MQIEYVMSAINEINARISAMSKKIDELIKKITETNSNENV